MTEPCAFASAWEAIRDVPGWLSEGQARSLFCAARSVRPGCSIVEIGSHQGRSTILLALAALPSVDVVAVDPFDAPRWGGGAGLFSAFRENLSRAGVDGSVHIFRGTSESAAAAWDGKEIGLVYVDGAHDRRSVLADIDGWAGWLGEGSLLFMHDAFSSVGVTAAILQRLLVQRRLHYIGAERSLVMFRRGDSSLLESASSSARLLARLPYFARNLVVKIALRRGWRRAALMLGHSETTFPY